MKKQDFTVLKIEDLRPFPDNPFRLVEDELLMEMAESIIYTRSPITRSVWWRMNC